MIVKYTGPHRGGLQQVGTLPISIKHGQPVELPDELAQSLLDGAPNHWSKVTPKTTNPKTMPPAVEAATPEEGGS